MRLNAPGLINESTDLGAVPMESRMIDGVLARQCSPRLPGLPDRSKRSMSTSFPGGLERVRPARNGSSENGGVSLLD